MKKYFLLYKILLLCLPGFAQLTIPEGVHWVNNGNVTVTMQNMNFVNNGNFIAGTGSMKFSGNQASIISGNNLPSLNILEIVKTNGAKLTLGRNISIGSSINFIAGQLDLNGSNIMLSPAAYIAGESENNRVVGSNGFIEISQDMNAPSFVNAGNLGATISSSANLGSVTIRRGHSPQSGTGLLTGINRYYFISSTNNNNLNATLRFKYFDAELNGQNESALVIYTSNNNGTDWNNLSQTTRNTNANYVEKSGMNDLSLLTLANDNVVLPDGATGVALTGQRKKPTEVSLKWTSLTETNMNGYQIQRKLKNETEFSDRAFVSTLVSGGNSNSLLTYQDYDDNAYTDTSFYRLKMLTNSATISYSNIITVPAKTKGGGNGNGNNRDTDEFTTVTGKTSVQSNSSTHKITLGPNPNNGNFWFSVIGLQKETTATLFYIDGKQIQQFKVVNLQQQRVTGLRSGVYLLNVPGFETQRIIVQGGEKGTPSSQTAIENNVKF